jgi:hypothetical protein
MPRRGESQYAVSSPGKTEDHKYARGHKQLSMNPPCRSPKLREVVNRVRATMLQASPGFGADDFEADPSSSALPSASTVVVSMMSPG